MSYESFIAFNVDQINEIEKAGLTIAELKDFYSRFPDQELETAIGGAVDEKKAKIAGATTPLESSLQESPVGEVSPTPATE